MLSSITLVVRNVSDCDLAGNLPSEVPIGLDGMILEETYLCISCSCQSTLETIQT